jgi:hypothetical protein
MAPLNASAIANANADLPLAVGPAIRKAEGADDMSGFIFPVLMGSVP